MWSYKYDLNQHHDVTPELTMQKFEIKGIWWYDMILYDYMIWYVHKVSNPTCARSRKLATRIVDNDS